MNEQFKHLVFYDGHCGFCDSIVQLLLKLDAKKLFVFAPLQGKTAKIFLNPPPAEDSLVLVEDYKGVNPRHYLLGKGALRILWLLGGGWSIIGILSFLPAILYDWIYRIIAKNRLRLFRVDRCVVPDSFQKSRFLE